jgi:hypothetical protein
VTDLGLEIRARGFARLSTGVTDIEGLAELERSLSEIGSLFRVFVRHPLWKPLGVDPDRPPGRSGGVGRNSLHIDCVNMENPPVLLHCTAFVRILAKVA